MEFSQSLVLGNSTLENIENAENNIIPAVKIIDDKNKKLTPKGITESDDDIVDESPTYKLPAATNSYRLGRRRALTSSTQNKRKLLNSEIESNNSYSVVLPKKSNLLSQPSTPPIESCNYSEFFKSSLRLEENIHGISNEKITNGSLEIFNTEDDEKHLNEIFNKCSEGFSDLMLVSEDVQDQDHLDNVKRTPEINNEMIVDVDTAFEIIKNDPITSLKSNPKQEDEGIDEFSNWDEINIGEDDIVLNIEDTTFITMNSNKVQMNTSECAEEKDDFIRKELENSKNELNENIIDLNNSSLYSKSLNQNNGNCSIINTSKISASSTDQIRLNWSSSTSVAEDKNDSKKLFTNNKNTSPNLNHPISSNIETLKEISSWNLPKSIQKQYESKGIKKMFDWQVECLTIPRVLFEHGNLVYSAPTSAGKTLVSEILVIKTILERRKKALIILPFISVVREKMYYMQNLLNSSGYRVEGFYGGYSPPGGFDSVHVAICTIEKANSIINRLLEQNKLDDIGVIVMDEIHLISDSSRGYILELLLSKMLYMCQKFDIKIQIITMSATISNSELLKKWLNADLYISNYRPVELKEMIKINSKIYDNQMNLIRDISVVDDDGDEDIKRKIAAIQNLPNDHDHIVQLCLETIIFDECSVIVFCPSKDWCETLCLHIANSIYSLRKRNHEMIAEKLNGFIKKEKIEEIKMQLKNIPTGLDSVLEKTITYGCAFHHAGLTVEERDLIETSFQNGILKVIVATSTLSSGVNLPARRVIIRSPLFGGKTMDPLTYRQMIGRAGRTGKDTLGESILICNESNSKAGKELIGANLKPLSSCLEFENSTHLKRAILEVISSGVATTKQDVELFLSCTLMYTQSMINSEKTKTSGKTSESSQSDCTINEKSQKNAINHCLEFLIEYEFIRLQNNDETNEIQYIPTRLGLACLSASMPPTDGIILLSELQKSRRCFVLESELHAVYLVTPYSVCYQLQNIDWLQYLDMWEKLTPAEKKVGELIGIRESFLVKVMRGQNKLDFKLLQIHKRFYIAMALQELVNETPINKVAAKYQLSRGLLQSLQQMSSTFAGIVTSFCNSLNWTLLGLIVSQFKERLYFGVQNDLIDLMRLPDLNSQRARALYNAGIHTLIDLAKTSCLEIEKILYNCISFDLSKKKDDEDEYEAKKRNILRNLYVTGREGLTIKDAAKSLINDARKFLEFEMGAKNINWENSNSQQNENQNENENYNEVNPTNNSVSPVLTSTPQTGNNFVTIQIDTPLEIEKVLNNENETLDNKENLPNSINQNYKNQNKIQTLKSSLRTQKVSKNEMSMRLRSKKSPDVNTNNKKNTKKIKSKNEKEDKLSPNNGPQIKRRSRNSAGNSSIEEIGNSQPQTTSSTALASIVAPKHTFRNLRPRLNQKRNEKENSNTAKCLNFENIESNSCDGGVDIIFESDSLQKNLFKNPYQVNSSHILKKSEIEVDSIDCLQIINVCGNLKLFEEVFKELMIKKSSSQHQQHSIGLSVGVQKLLHKKKPLIGGNLLINQIDMKANEKHSETDFIFDDDFYVTGISICQQGNIVFFVNMQQNDEKRDDKISNEMIVMKIRSLFNNHELKIRIFDAKEQLKILKKILPNLNEIQAKIEDPKVASWLLQPDNELNFKSMVQEYAPEYSAIADIAGTVRTYSSIALNCKSSIIGKVRSAVESCVVLHIVENQIENLNKFDNGQLMKFFSDLEMPLQISLYKMESIGFPVDELKLENLTQTILETMKKIENKIFEIHGSRFNLSSSTAVARVLGLYKKSNGKISTSKQILEKIDSPIANLIMNYRKLNATLTKTIQPLSRCVINNRIHGRSLTFTATGRISMHEPNLQNVTKNFEIDLVGHEKISIMCRNCFIAPSGKSLMSADFCQLEMRILAHLSQDPTLIKVMNSEGDVFTAIASKWNKIPENEVSEALRNGTKQICYGIIYGMGIKSLSDSLKCDEQEANTVLDQFHLAYPGIRTYIDKVSRFAEQNGYVETITGRRRYLTFINSLNSNQKAQALRQAVNTTIQGSAADISKNAILKMEKYLTKYRQQKLLLRNPNLDELSDVNFILHLHDELIFEVPKSSIPQVGKALKLAMESCVKLSVPLKVRLKVGDSWGSMCDYKF